MKKISVLIIFIVFSFIHIALGQNENDVIKNSIAKLKTRINDHVIEKAYLHLDHPYPYYVAGDIIYFKAYVTMGELHQPSTISQILHVDLIDKNNIIHNTIALFLDNGAAWGDFNLPETLQKGVYRIRAYTDWMRNEKQPAFFEQYVSVASVNNTDRVAESTKTGSQASLQFFPEGGNLVSGIPSKVAFKAIGINGLGIDFKGVVVDNLNNEISKIAPSHSGMGKFDFRPLQGRFYKAKVTFADGTQAMVDLPVAVQKGITLAVDNVDADKLSIEIKANQAYYRENLDKELNLIIYSGGAVRTVKTKLDNPVLGLDLRAADFRTGIVQVTLLSQNSEPLAERLTFVQNDDLLKINVNTNKNQFAKRENVSLNFNVQNKEGIPASGSFSIAVIDESKVLVEENAENSILSYLLLTSDLKGYIEKPNYYFANITNETRRDMDVLMLTQGYRRFSWKQLQTDDDNLNAAQTFAPEKGLYLTGDLKTTTGLPIADEKLTLIPATGGQSYTTNTNGEGKFKFTNVFFETGSQFVLKTEPGKHAMLNVDKAGAGPTVTAASPIESTYNANADLLASLQNTQKTGIITASIGSAPLLLQEDQPLKKINNNFSYRSSNLGGPGHADQVILRDQFKNAPSLSAGINGVARNVHFVGGIPYLPSSQVVTYAGESNESMLIVVDGINFGSGISIDTYNPNDVETIEILKGNNAAIYGMQGGAGVLVLTTTQGTEKVEHLSKEMSPGIFSVAPMGLYKAREFYMPVYDVKQPANTNLPDRRTTIFWTPNANTDANGNASFNFYNADGTGTYRVVIEGVDKKGNLGRKVFKYHVD